MSCVPMVLTMILNTQGHHTPTMKIARTVCKYSAKYEVDPVLVVALMKHESDFRVRSYHRAGDYGLMQIHAEHRFGAKWINRKRCNLYGIDCNIAKGVKFLAIWKKACKKHRHKSHWLRHYNWRSPKHHLKVLWLTEAYKQAFAGKIHLYRTIKYDKYRRLRISRSCVPQLCGVK